MKKIAIFLLLSRAVLFGQVTTNPNCYVTGLDKQQDTGFSTNTTDQLRIQAKNPLTGACSTTNACNYIVSTYIDDPTMTDATKVINSPSAPATTVVYDLTQATGSLITSWGTAAINPKDGNQHSFNSFMAWTGAATGSVACGGGQQAVFKYNSATGHSTFSFPLPANVRRYLNRSNLSIGVSSLIPFSIGTTGTTICGGLFPDGYAYQYVVAHSIPCNHVHIMAIPSGSDSIASGTMATLTASTFAALDPVNEQAWYLTWNSPSNVSTPSGTPLSMTGYFETGGVVPGYNPIVISGVNSFGDAVSPYFPSPLVNNPGLPFTLAGLRPAMMVGAAVCTNCTTIYTGTFADDIATGTSLISRGLAAVDSQPTGCVSYLSSNSGDYNRSAVFRLASLDGFGSGNIFPGITESAVAVTGTPTISPTNTIFYVLSAANLATASTATFCSPGGAVMMNTTSTSGQTLQGAGQTPASVWIHLGAVGAMGPSLEPNGMTFDRMILSDQFQAWYYQGATLIEAFALSLINPFGSNIYGDPLASPFRQTAPPLTSCGAIVGACQFPPQATGCSISVAFLNACPITLPRLMP